MRLHARSVAAAAGAPREVFDKVVDDLVAQRTLFARETGDDLAVGKRGREVATIHDGWKDDVVLRGSQRG